MRGDWCVKKVKLEKDSRHATFEINFLVDLLAWGDKNSGSKGTEELTVAVN